MGIFQSPLIFQNPPVNTDFKDVRYVNYLTKEVKSIEACQELQNLMQELVAKYEKQLEEVMKEQKILKILKEFPTDLISLIKWVKNFIENKIVGPYGKTITRYVRLGTAYAQLAQAIASRIGTLTCLFNPMVMVDFAMSLATWTVTKLGGAILDQTTNAQGLNSYKMLAKEIGDLASMAKQVTGLASRFGVNLGMNINALNISSTGGMLMSFVGNSAKSILKMDSNGILANNGGIFTRVFSGNMQDPGVFQNLKFSIDQTVPEATTISGTLDNVPIFAGVPAASEVGSFTPEVYMQVSTDSQEYTDIDITHLTINNLDLDHQLVSAYNAVGPNFGATGWSAPMMGF